MQLIYLAAGRGSRLGNLTKNLPKCLTLIKKKTILDYNISYFKYFSKVMIITGYKSHLIKKKIKKKNVIFIKNNKYKNTNMVYSTFLSWKSLNKNEDIVICYGDIIFDHKIIKKLLKNKGNVAPLKSNWLSVWKKRMDLKKIKDDAEMINTQDKEITSIGQKIKKKMPKLQYMGILKFNFRSFKKLYLQFFELSNKISFTNFLNHSLNKKIIKLNFFETKRMWIEIDTKDDIKAAEQTINYIKL